MSCWTGLVGRQSSPWADWWTLEEGGQTGPTAPAEKLSRSKSVSRPSWSRLSPLRKLLKVLAGSSSTLDSTLFPQLGAGQGKEWLPPACFSRQDLQKLWRQLGSTLASCRGAWQMEQLRVESVVAEEFPDAKRLLKLRPSKPSPLTSRHGSPFSEPSRHVVRVYTALYCSDRNVYL